MNERPGMGVLLSGTGRTLENLLQERAAGRLPFDLRCVISSRNGVRGLEIGKQAVCPTLVCRRADAEDDEAYGRELSRILLQHDVQLVVLAGFLQRFLAAPALADRVINIHPALLPAFGGRGLYGHHVHQAVLDSGVKVSGCSVHFVDREYDSGPIILQRTVPVYYNDTVAKLADRVFEEECKAYPDAIRLFFAGRLRVDGRRVEVLSPE